MEKGPALHILTNLRRLRSRSAAHGHVLARDRSIQSRDIGKRHAPGCERCTRQSPMHIPKPNPDVRIPPIRVVRCQMSQC